MTLQGNYNLELTIDGREPVTRLIEFSDGVGKYLKIPDNASQFAAETKSIEDRGTSILQLVQQDANYLAVYSGLRDQESSTSIRFHGGFLDLDGKKGEFSLTQVTY